MLSQYGFKGPSLDGFVVCNPSDPNIADVIKEAKCKIINYGEFF